MSSNTLEATYAEWVACPTAENLNALARATHAHALRLVRRYSGLDPEELAQQTTIACWKTLTQYGPQRCPYAAWIATITRNKAKDVLRSRYRGPQLESWTEERTDLKDDLPPTIDLRPVIRGGYTPEERTIMDGWSKDIPNDEMAVALQVSQSTLRKRQSRLRKKIIMNRVKIRP